MGARVLIAEDDQHIRTYLEQMLTMEGYQAHGVDNGGDCLHAVESFAPHALILDVMMPVADGMTVLRELRSRPETLDLPVILLTARADNESTWEGWRAGCNMYMVKPFEPDDLLASVAQLLSERKSA